MKMNVPNFLTILRMCMVPVFVIFMLADVLGPSDQYIAAVLFILASITDWLDGYLARKNHQVTVFGKFMDPLADKLLVCSALICLIELGRIPSWVVIIIVGREFIISGFRLVAAEGGKVIAAGYWGKIKTAVTMVTIVFMIPNFGEIFSGASWIYPLEQVLVYASLILTIISLIDYLVKNKEVLGGEM